VARIELVLDCADLERQVQFWTAAFDYRHVDTEGGYALLVPADDAGPRLVLQLVPEPKTVKNRFHLDIRVDDIEAEAARLVALGATRRRDEPFEELGERWITMADPEGNELCVCSR
jgi:predicted enzyme related to lactoylglutathione lyase